VLATLVTNWHKVI